MEGSESEKVFDSLDLNPRLFINEALNIVDDLVDGASDCFDREAAAMLKTEDTNRSEELIKCVASTFKMLKSTLDTKLSTWEYYCLSHCFTVPEGFSLPKVDVSSYDASLNGLDAKLDSLGDEICQCYVLSIHVYKEFAELKREVHALERESTISSQIAASLTEVLELCNQQQHSTNDQFKELMQLALIFFDKMENLIALRTKKICISNGDVSLVNFNDGLCTATPEDLEISKYIQVIRVKSFTIVKKYLFPSKVVAL